MQQSFTQTIVGQTLNLDMSLIRSSQKQTLESLCTDIFLIVIKMREAEDLGEPQSLRKLIKYYLDLLEKNCRQLDVPSEDVEHIKYACVALIDETVLSIPGQCRDLWISNPLQLEYFNDNLAGEGFFRKLEKLVTIPHKKREVLEVFFLALSLGFEGKYRIADSEVREQIIDDLGFQLNRLHNNEAIHLSPHGQNRTLFSGSRTCLIDGVPLWAIGAAGSGILLLLWGVLILFNNSVFNNIMKFTG